VQEGLREVRMTTVFCDLFPPVPRVLYGKAPLFEVTCQSRFPPILQIDRPPAEFQERIREQFPLLERLANPLVVPQLPPEAAQMLGAAIGQSGWNFLTEDRSSIITLAPDYVALTSTKYERWERFREQYQLALTALRAVYRPSFFVRIGLRYRDLIRREILGLDGVGWSRLLRPEILGELAIKEFEERAQDAKRVLILRMPGEVGTLILQHGFGKAVGHDKPGYVIDLDIAVTNKTEAEMPNRSLICFTDQFEAPSVGASLTSFMTPFSQLKSATTDFDAFIDTSALHRNLTTGGYTLGNQFPTVLQPVDTLWRDLTTSDLYRLLCVFLIGKLNDESLTEAWESLAGIYSWQRQSEGIEITPSQVTAFIPSSYTSTTERTPFPLD
jgi:uncharacterized protein (TIGR04255 family)